MKFIGREEEVRIIKRELDRNSMSALMIYGRRRVGKTELISYCLRDRKENILYFTAQKSSYEENFERFSSYIKEKYEISYNFNNLDSLLQYISQKSHEKKTILVIDEYSYFNNEKTVDSSIQQFIDSNTNNNNLKLIISGSVVHVMTSIIESNQPLYGRFTSIIMLKSFNYYEASKFYPERRNEEKIALYSVFGGVPHYIKLIDPQLSVDENIINLFFSKNLVMESEIEILLNSELSKIETANAILSYLNKSHLSYKDINQKLSSYKNSNGSTYVLNKLLSIDIIDKEIEVNKTDSNRGAYFIKDNALLFYYSFVYPNKNKMSLMSPEIFYNEKIKKELYDNFIPRQFEKICKEFLIMSNKNNLIHPVFYSIGNLIYHDKERDENHEYDIVTEDKNGYIYYECKYTNKALIDSDIDKEISKSNTSLFRFYNYGFFSKSGYKNINKDNKYILYTLDDLYGSNFSSV